MTLSVEQATILIAKAAETTPLKVPIDTVEMVQAVQVKLRSLRYVNAGPPDGKEGEKTAAAILDFRNRNNLPISTAIDGELLNALLIAAPKELPASQVTATETQIAPKVDAVNRTLWGKFWAKVAAIPAAIVSLVLGIVSNLGDAINALTPLKTFLSDWLEGIDRLTIVAIATSVTALVSGFMWLNTRGAAGAMTEGYRKGSVVNDNREAPPPDDEEA